MELLRDRRRISPRVRPGVRLAPPSTSPPRKNLRQLDAKPHDAPVGESPGTCGEHPRLAPAHLDAWLAWATRSRLVPFIRLARTIRRHRAGILAAIRLGLSNGRLEGLNSRIRLISHRSFGFHSATPLIALVYLCCARITIDLPR